MRLLFSIFASKGSRDSAGDASEEKTMANVHDATRDVAKPEISADEAVGPDAAAPRRARRGFSLSLAALRGKKAEVADHALMQEGAEGKKTKRAFSLGLPALRRKSADAVGAEIDTKSPENVDIPAEAPSKPKRGFSLPLPSLRRKADRGSDAESPKIAVRKPRKKEAFQSAALQLQDETEAPTGLSGKIQMLMARLTPAERTPKALVGRPDPFDRLAAEAQKRASAR